MLFHVDFKSGKPSYLQVADQVRAAAASGALRPGEALPAIGPLAGELRVNRNAIARAYSELEGLGLIERRPDGRFCLKENGRQSAREARANPLAAEIDQAIVQAPLLLYKALTYSLLAASLGSLYAGLLLSVSLGPVLAAAAAAALFLPMRNLSGRLARALVFAKRFELPRVLRILKAEAMSHPNLDAFLQRVAERSEAVLGARPEWIGDRHQVLALVQSCPALRSARSPVFAGADLLMPVFSSDEVSGILRLAPKSTGEEYTAADLKFLGAVGEQVAVTASQFRLRHERQESEYALDIQQALLPREIPRVPGFTIAGSWLPARTVGGDYYDVFPLTDSEVAFLVADVSGKGMAAALLMANLQATVKAYATLESSPQDLCARVNRAICRSIAQGRFITFFYAVLDAEHRRLTYANAGHNPPLLVRRDGSLLRLTSGGAVLGLFAEGAYESACVELRAGDRLLLFTDGITEAANSNGEELGEERLIALMEESSADSAVELRDAILQRVTQFCEGDFADDATLLALVVEQSA